MSARLMIYDISEGKVLTTQDENVPPTHRVTAVPNMAGAWVMTRDSPVQLGTCTAVIGIPVPPDQCEVLAPHSSVSLCLQPSAIAPMKCVDNDDLGAWEVTPTAIDNDCFVISFNLVYAEAGEASCESSFCQGTCARDALTAAQPRACWRAP